MSERFFYLDQLFPVDALHILSSVAAEKQGQGMEVVRIQVSVSLGGAETAIVVPDPVPLKRPNPIQSQLVEKLIALYEQHTKRPPRPASASDNTLPLPQGVSYLFFHSQVQQDFVFEEQDEYLLIIRGSDKARQAEIFESVRFHGTHAYAALATSPTTGEDYLLLHIRHDHERRSSYPSLMASEFFPEISLHCFSEGEFKVFLPPGFQPDRAALSSFCQLLRNAPHTFSSIASSSASHLLAALVPLPGDPSAKDIPHYEILHLAGLDFQSQIKLAPVPQKIATLEFLPIANSSQMAEVLHDAIEALDPPVGYRLELRRTRHLESSEAKRAHLREQLARIEYQLAYLNSLAEERPILFRFTQRQLPALAKLLRTFPGNILKEGAIKYGFQATDHHPEHRAGVHFLYLEGKHIATMELNPLLLMGEPDDKPMQFWLDPFWARWYHGQGSNKCLVFVPEGTTLFPTMHSWDVGEMDIYMRRIMEKWFHGHYGVAKLPAQPIYLFDGEPDPETEIYISVLDFERMVPLHAQLGWLNDNLTIQDDLGIETFLKAMAQDITRRELADHVREQANQAEAAFKDAAQETAGRIAHHTAQLTQDMTSLIEHLIEETYQNTLKAKELSQRLNALRDFQIAMEQIATQTDDVRQDIGKKAAAVAKQAMVLRKTVEDSVQVAYHTSQNTRDKVQKTIQDLERTLRDLRRKLSSLSTWRE